MRQTSIIVLFLTVIDLSSLSPVRVSSPVIESVEVARYLMTGARAVLHCRYTYPDQLYSVRWYKNGKEFYSFVLDKAEPQSVHPVAGVTVDLAGSSRSTVSLLSVSRETTGRFRCEVSGAAPVFPTDTKYADLLVVEAPSSAGPLISGSRGRYDLGDTATINCSLASTWPAANLTWYINNKRVKPQDVKLYTDPAGEYLPADGVLQTTLGIKIKLRRRKPDRTPTTDSIQSSDGNWKTTKVSTAKDPFIPPVYLFNSQLKLQPHPGIILPMISVIFRRSS